MPAIRTRRSSHSQTPYSRTSSNAAQSLEQEADASLPTTARQFQSELNAAQQGPPILTDGERHWLADAVTVIRNPRLIQASSDSPRYVSPSPSKDLLQSFRTEIPDAGEWTDEHITRALRFAYALRVFYRMHAGQDQLLAGCRFFTTVVQYFKEDKEDSEFDVQFPGLYLNVEHVEQAIRHYLEENLIHGPKVVFTWKKLGPSGRALPEESKVLIESHSGSNDRVVAHAEETVVNTPSNCDYLK